MLPLLIDENFDHRIIRGLRLQIPNLDYVITQQAGLKSLDDPALLAWAAEHQRIVVMHDVNTLPMYAYERVRDGALIFGVIIVPEDLAIGTAIEELAMLIECSATIEFENLVIYLPI